MKYLRSFVFFLATALLYLGLPLLGWGLDDLRGFFSLAPRLGYALSVAVFAAAIVFEIIAAIVTVFMQLEMASVISDSMSRMMTAAAPKGAQGAVEDQNSGQYDIRPVRFQADELAPLLDRARSQRPDNTVDLASPDCHAVHLAASFRRH